MYEFLAPPQEPVDVDREQFAGCTDQSRKLAEDLALYYQSATRDDRLVNLEPGLDLIYDWQQEGIEKFEIL